MLKVVNLAPSFIEKIAGLKETIHDKSRPHGIVTISVNGLTFAIPLRSNMSHPYGVVLDTVVKNKKRFNRGLDFTKALIITDETTELGSYHSVSKAQKEVLIRKKKMIINQFQKYVVDYVNAVKNDIANTVNSNAYQYSTLCNYHAELGLAVE